MNGSAKTVEEYLKAPYARVLTPDEEDGGFTAEILEFPGCFAEGETADEAYRNLEAAAEGWIQAALDLGQDIPEPSMPQGYGGRVALRLPRSLHRRAVQLAERDGTSLNQFLVAAVAERVGASNLYSLMTERLERRSMESAVNIAQIAVNSIAGAGPPLGFGMDPPISVNVSPGYSGNRMDINVLGGATTGGPPSPLLDFAHP